MKIILAVFLIVFSINIFANNPQNFVDSLQISNFSEFDFLNLIFRENFHLFSPNKNLYFHKNGFSIIPFKTQSIQILQDFAPHYRTDISRNFVDFRKSNYDNNIPITETFLGLGDEEMKHAFVKFSKGNVFGLKNSGIEISYLAQSGNWFNKNEKSKNFDLHLFYHFDFGNLHFYNSTFDQNIAEIKFLQNSILDTIKFAENAIIWENDFVNFGVHSEFYKVDSERRQLYEMMINKEVTTNKHLLNATFEQFWGDSLFSIFSLNHKSKFSNFKFSNFGYFNNENDYQATSKFTIHINEKISTNVGYFTDYAFCGINLWNNQFSIGYKNKNYFYEFKNKFKMKFFILQLKINNYLILDEKNIKFASLTETFQTQNKIEITYLMKHNNNITLDLNHIRLSGDSHLNAALKFQITKFFELSTTAINLTNSSQLFGEKITGRHFNFNVRWIFLN